MKRFMVLQQVWLGGHVITELGLEGLQHSGTAGWSTWTPCMLLTLVMRCATTRLPSGTANATTVAGLCCRWREEQPQRGRLSASQAPAADPAAAPASSSAQGAHQLPERPPTAGDTALERIVTWHMCMAAAAQNGPTPQNTMGEAARSNGSHVEALQTSSYKSC